MCFSGCKSFVSKELGEGTAEAVRSCGSPFSTMRPSRSTTARSATRIVEAAGRRSGQCVPRRRAAGWRSGGAATWDGTKRRLPALVGAVLLTFLGALLLVVLLFGLPVGWLVAAGDAQPVPIVLLVLAAIALVPISLFLWTRLAFVTAVIVLEERGVFSAFARSWQLTSGTPFWRILGIRILTSVAVAVAAYLITLPLTIAGFALVFSLGDEGDLFMWQAILGGVASLISGAITTPFSAGVDALLAIDQRIRREGLDVQLIHASQQGGPAPWPSAAGAR